MSVEATSIISTKKDSYLILLLIWLVFAVATNFSFFESGFDLIRGSKLDPRLMIAILEHWYQAFIGNQELLRPLYFFPSPQYVLSFSDTLFLNSLFYSLCRPLVSDEYLAFQGAQFVSLLFGYLTFFCFTRRILGCSYLASLLGSILFTFAAPMIRLLSAFQNSSTYFLPLLAILFAKFIEQANNKRNTQYLYLGGFWILIGAIAFSTLYTVWFLIFFCFFFSLSFLAIYPKRVEFLRLMTKPLLFSAMFAPLCMLPFAILYWPMMGTNREYEEIFLYLYPLADLPNGNTPIWKSLLSISRPTELNVYPPTIGFSMALCIGIIFYFIGRKRIERTNSWDDALILSVFSSLLLCLLMIMKFGGHAPWWFIYEFIPGGGAIRVLPRLFFILSFFASVAMVMIGDLLLKKIELRLYRNLFIPFIVLAIVDQLGMPVASLSRREEFQRLGQIQAPRFKADAFVIAESGIPSEHFFVFHIDAMLVANRLGIPTFYGYSGWFPTGYPITTPPDKSPLFHETLKRWASLQNFRGTIGIYNLKTNKWRRFLIES